MHSVKTKLFIVMLLANSVLIAAMLLFNSIGFNRGFEKYVVQLETRQLSPIIERLVAYHERTGDWSALQASGQWSVLIDQAFPPPSHSNGGRMMSMVPRYVDRLQLLNAQREPIITAKNDATEVYWVALRNEQKQVVGYLGFEPRARTDARLDRLFRQQVRNQLLGLAAIGLLLAVVIALPFASFLVRPIERLTQSVRHMAKGRYDIEVNVQQKDELGQLAEDVNRLAQVLRENQQARQQWVTDIAHELRTPISVMQGDIEAAQDGIRQADAKWLAAMHQQTQRIANLVADLNELSLSDVGSLNYQFETVNADQLLGDWLAQHQSVLTQSSLTVHLACQAPGAYINADERRLHQLWLNLLQNTQRYTDAPGQLSIQTEVVNGQWVVQWADSSPGVSAEDRPKLFDRLFRVEASRNRATGGAGLGLAIVKNIVQAHGGEVTAQASALGGLAVIITLPVQEQ